MEVEQEIWIDGYGMDKKRKKITDIMVRNTVE